MSKLHARHYEGYTVMRYNRMNEQQQRTYDRLFQYSASYGERFLKRIRHGRIHLFGEDGIWYVFPYYKKCDWGRLPEKPEKRLHAFWKFMDGDEKYAPYFYLMYVKAIRQLLWMCKVVGEVELVAVPRSDPGADNPVRDVCAEIAEKETFLLAKAIDGSDIIRRRYKMVPVHRGGKYSVSQIKDSMELSRPLQAKIIILIDDMVYSGKTIDACRRLLQMNGAKKVYAICLYGYKRHETS